MHTDPTDEQVDALIAANPSGMTADQIATAFGFTRQRAFQIIDRAVEKVRRKLATRAIYSCRDVVSDGHASHHWRVD